MKKIFLGLMACAALCACTSDDLVSLGNETQKVFEGDVAYMTVSIKDVNSSTRATFPDNSFAYGSADEYAVKDAYFYFYDAAGVFVSEAEVWDGGTPSTHVDQTPDGNIEFDGETVIILKGLTQKNYPNYVVTVLNRPDGFTPGETLDEMATLLADASAVGIMQGTNTNFTMSTSSYVANASGAADERLAYFATPIPSDAFYTEPIADDLSEITPVDIYVERLAAKVEVGLGAALATNSTTYNDSEGTSHTIYKLEETVGGDPNVEDVEEDEGGQEVGDGIGAEDIYVELLGWALNATAKHSNIVKEIDANWTNTGSTSSTSGYDLGTGWSWNDPTDFRSYWGKSFNYGLTPAGGYPTSSEGATDGTSLNEYLNYVSYNDLNNTLGATDGQTTTSGTAEYCAENTNTATGTTQGGIISHKNSSAITSVLIAAKVCDESGNALDLVRYNGELFTKEDYLNYVMNYLTATGKLNVYTATVTSEGTTYTHIDSTYVTLSDTYGTGDDEVTLTDGLVAVVVKANVFDTSVTYYEKEATTGEFTAITPEAGSTVADMVTAQLDAFNEDANANAFIGGLMYYNIPIEHLNNTTGTNQDTGLPIIYEANYGVVRNHWYRLTITSIEDLGTGVYDPDEVIIPNPDDVPTYYIGADIHILSWKLVDQSVSL